MRGSSARKNSPLGEEYQTSLVALQDALTRLTADARVSAQAANNSAAPEILDAVEQILCRIANWDESVASSMDPIEHERLLREGRSLGATLRKLKISLETE